MKAGLLWLPLLLLAVVPFLYFQTQTKAPHYPQDFFLGVSVTLSPLPRRSARPSSDVGQDLSSLNPEDVIIRPPRAWQSHSDAFWNKQFWEEGVIGPFPLLEEEELPALREAAYTAEKLRSPRVPWDKNRFFSSSLLLSLALHPTLVTHIQALLGPNLVLMGTILAHRGVDTAHRWHVDVETRQCKETATVWMGLQNINLNTSLMILTRTFRSKFLPQELQNQDVTLTENENLNMIQMVEAAKVRVDAESKLIRHDMSNGEFIVFQGQTWHGSVNPTGESRDAMVIQYMAGHCVVRRPMEYNPPYQVYSLMPPTIWITGTLDKDFSKMNNVLVPTNYEAFSKNIPRFFRPGLRLSSLYHDSLDEGSPRAVEAPLPGTAHRPPLEDTFVFHPSPQLLQTNSSYTLLDTKTPVLDRLHISWHVLQRFATPHPPHLHPEAELIYVTEGEVRITRLPVPGKYDWGPFTEEERQVFPDELPEETIAEKGDIIYHPANVAHTITGLSSPHSSYLSIRFFKEEKTKRSATTLPPLIVKRALGGTRGGLGSATILRAMNLATQTQSVKEHVFITAPTETLSELQGHAFRLPKGKSLSPHVDVHDALLLVEKGQATLLPGEERLEVGDVIYAPAGRSHGLRNDGKTTYQQVAIEFHP
ncbi:hypothetical protein QOT17_021417 [Balamuthia mandrillaris]